MYRSDGFAAIKTIKIMREKDGDKETFLCTNSNLTRELRCDSAVRFSTQM